MSKMRPFTPHNFDRKLKFCSDLPTVRISRLAYNKMCHIVDLSNLEVSWLGSVLLVDGDFQLEDVFIFKQEVDSVMTAMTPENLAQFGTKLIDELGDAALPILDKVRLWGHSHVHGTTHPSGQDNREMDLFSECGHPWFIRLIATKEGRLEFNIYFYGQDFNWKITDAEWSIYEEVDDSLKETIRQELQEKVTARRTRVYHQPKNKNLPPASSTSTDFWKWRYNDGKIGASSPEASRYYGQANPLDWEANHLNQKTESPDRIIDGEGDGLGD